MQSVYVSSELILFVYILSCDAEVTVCEWFQSFTFAWPQLLVCGGGGGGGQGASVGSASLALSSVTVTSTSSVRPAVTAPGLATSTTSSLHSVSPLRPAVTAPSLASYQFSVTGAVRKQRAG